jgi:hypothetical protein
MAQMGGNTGLGIGMPQGGVLSPAPADNRLTFDEGLLRTLCDLDVSTLTEWFIAASNKNLMLRDLSVQCH